MAAAGQMMSWADHSDLTGVGDHDDLFGLAGHGAKHRGLIDFNCGGARVPGRLRKRLQRRDPS